MSEKYLLEQILDISDFWIKRSLQLEGITDTIKLQSEFGALEYDMQVIKEATLQLLKEI